MVGDSLQLVFYFQFPALYFGDGILIREWTSKLVIQGRFQRGVFCFEGLDTLDKAHHYPPMKLSARNEV
jgi:hypothetical protein